MLSKNLNCFLLLFLLICSCHCNKEKKQSSPTSSAPGFYYWKTTLNFDKQDKKMADSLGVKKFYLRYFDVDWSPTRNMSVPLGELQTSGSGSWVWQEENICLADYQVIPVVYITHRVFEKEKQVEQLAEKIAKKIKEHSGNLAHRMIYDAFSRFEQADVKQETKYRLEDTLKQQFLNQMTEIQIDYDWTNSTQKQYFRFLEAIKQHFPNKLISCTIRLHQFRDKKQAGIPPVEKGMLMCYNVAPPSDIQVKDAIFDIELAKGYLKSTEYPLALDAALPLFSWGALFHENQFKGLAAGFSEMNAKNNSLFKNVGNARYQFTQDTVFADVYMREGDMIRVDEASMTDLQGLQSQLSKISAIENIAFFEWQTDKISSLELKQFFD